MGHRNSLIARKWRRKHQSISAAASPPEADSIGRHSISKQLTVFLIMAIGVISIAAIAAAYLYRAHVAKEQLSAKADELYVYLAGILEKSLWDIDEKNIRVIGETISQNEVVAALTISDSFGQTIYEMAREKQSNAIQREGKIFHEGALAGYVQVSLTRKFYDQSSRQLLFASLLTLVIALVVLIFTTGVLIRRFLKGPLESLNHILDDYSAGIYEPRGANIPYLEFQPFGRVLDDMGKRITQQLKEVKQAEEKYRNIFENAVEGIFQSTIEGHFVSVSPSMARLFGYDTPQILIEEVTDIGAQCYANPEDRDEFTRRINRDGLVHRFESQMVRRDKSFFWVSISARLVFDEKGQPGFYEGFCIDITRQKNLETQLRQAHKMEAIGTLAGGIAHDFNNILGVIIGCTELALEKIAPGRDEISLLERVLRAARRARELVKQVLTFSRQDKSEIKPLYLHPIVKETLKFIGATAPATIRIEQAIENDAGAVLGDPTQVHRLLMNLYTNAVHAMQTKGGVLNVSLADKDLSSDTAAHADLKAGPYVELCVRDTGHGMSPETMVRIFDPFFTTKPVGEGTGLGLSVVHGIVKKHNGGIVVESQPEKGTTFKVYFPRLDKRHIQIMGELEAGVPVGNERILLVDDERELLDTLQQMLEELGYSVTVTSSSLDAYDRFRRAPEDFDLIVADLTMPGMTGIDLAKKIKCIHPDIPIILCTGFSELTASQQAQEAGAWRVLYKPVARWQLATAIRAALRWEQNGRNSDH
jgi:PAS domain S-box-containing protein